jgi:NAD(P)-dependent dehydrogenase (short-subunit alcohol dehydrogenase family)
MHKPRISDPGEPSYSAQRAIRAEESAVSDFKGKVALVTGASRGIGASEVRLLAAKGAKVLATDILDDLGTFLARELSDSGAIANYLHLDATVSADWARAVEQAIGIFGRLDILINNAGVHGRLGLEETSEEEWHRVLDHDLKTTWLGMKHCVPVMRRFGGGAIVNTSSVYGLIASGKATAYHAAKGGVLMVSRAAAVEYAQDGIRVNSIHPGIIETPMTDTLPPPWKARLMEATPMKRSASADEVARAAIFLVSDDASFITGTQLIVDGGLTAV